MTSVDDAQIAQFDSRSIPVVAIDAFGDQPDRIPTVGSNNWSGAFSATKHLIDLGHTRIGMISGPIRYLNSRARVDGYRSALESCGLDIDRSLIRYGDFFFTGGALHARDLLTRDNRPTAIFAGSDLKQSECTEPPKNSASASPTTCPSSATTVSNSPNGYHHH